MKLPNWLEDRLDQAQADALRAFAGLLEARAVPLGLISAADRGRIFERHVVDSVRAAALFAGDEPAVDLGSGAGLPGIPLAIALPHCRFALVEARARRAGFLELALERLGLGNARVVRARVEEVDEQFDVALARAFADLETTWRAAHRLLREGGRLVYFAGGRLADPLAAAAAVTSPAPAAHVAMDPVLESATPLVIMTRG